MYVCLCPCICICEVCMCVREGGQPWVSVLTFHLAWGGLFTRGPLCPLLHLPSPCLSCSVRLLTGFWGLKSRSSSLHSKCFYCESNPQPPDTDLMLSLLWVSCQVAVLWVSRVSSTEPSHLRDGPAPSLHLTEVENKTVQSCKRPVTKAGPHNLHVSKVAYGLKRATQPWRFWSAYGHDGTNRNLSDYDLHNSELMILSCFYTGLKLRKWKYAKSHWKEEKTLKATGTCWILQAPGTEKAVAALGTSYHCDNIGDKHLRRRAHPGQPRRKGTSWAAEEEGRVLAYKEPHSIAVGGWGVGGAGTWGGVTWHPVSGEVNAAALSVSFTQSGTPVHGGHPHLGCVFLYLGTWPRDSLTAMLRSF